MPTGVVALLGSGETAPGMTKVHRDLLARLDPVRAVTLDTAYGFQENVPQMTEKLVGYFAESLLTPLEPLHLPSYDGASPVQRELVKRDVAAATYVFAGPGSPSWALAQWTPLGLADDLLAVLASGGTLCFASAAALTLGAFTAPIYELYKVGVAEPYWLAGLDVMGRIGLDCAVIPHFDNREGQNYDTRYCYLGERRLLELERQLPAAVATLGVDEHTAAIIDLGAATITVRGRGHAYWRRDGGVVVMTSQRATPFSELGASRVDAGPTPAPAARAEPVDDLDDLSRRVLDGGDSAVGALADLVARARVGRPGLVDPEPLVASLLALRAEARSRGDFTTADAVRDALTDGGVEIRDSPDGTSWELAD
ncbi:MAG TPA: hypothetical protein VGS61_06305 [Acidimicrobiales bacterium]|nr:hypothetical protein [Acidimicrobiales bacterium]